MTRKIWCVRLAAFLAAVALMFSASLVNTEFLNTSARAEEETALPVAEEAVPQVTEAEEETVPQAVEEAAPQVVEAVEETVPQATEEAAQQVTEAVEETVPQAAEEVVPQVTETEKEEAPEIESEPEPAAEPEDHREDAQPEAAAGDNNDETDDDPEWTEDEWIDDPEEDEDLAVIEDDDAGSVSEEILEPFNNPELYEQEAFVGTAEIRLMNEGMLNYGDEIILKADVRDVDVSYRLVWEANDNDGHGWFTVGSGEEYRFILDRENAAREYRVEIFAVD